MRDAKVKKIRAVATAFVALSLVAAACGSDKDSSSSGATTTEAAKQGGDLVFAADQEGATMDLISSDAGGVFVMKVKERSS